MAKIIYNKLVRDKIPEVIEALGKTCETKIIEGEALKTALILKLKEEVSEFEESHSIEEIADVLEVIDGICKFNNWSMEEILAVKEVKKLKRGGFDEGVFLLEADE